MVLKSKIKHHKIIVFYSVLVCALLVIAVTLNRHNLSIFGMLPILTVLLFSLSVSKKNLSFLESIYLVLLSYFTLNIVIYTLLSLFDIGYSKYIIVLIFAASLVTYFYQISKSGIDLPEIDITDIIVIAIIILTFFFLAYPFLSSDSAQRLNLLTMGEDNASHFAMYNSILRNGELAVYNDSSGIITTLKFYPQGLHSFFASNATAFQSGDTILHTINMYILQISLSYALLIGALALFIKNIFALFDTTLRAFIVYLSIVPLFLYFVSFGFLFYLFTYGFHTQIASYLIIIVSVLLLSKYKNHKLNAWVIFASLIAIANSWYFVLPICIAMYIYYLIINKIKLNKGIITVLLFGLMIGSVPIITEMLHANGASGLLLGGAVWRVQPIVLILLSCSVVITLINYKKIVSKFSLAKRIKSASYLNSLLMISGVSIVFTILIGAYQTLKLGRVEYYYFKSQYLIALILLILCSWLLAWFLFNVIHYLNASLKTSLIVATVILFFGTSVWVYIKPSEYISAYKNSTLSTYLDVNAINFALNKMSNINYTYVDDCTSYSKYMTLRWLGALQNNDNDIRHGHSISMLDDKYTNDAYLASEKQNIIISTGLCNK